MDGVFGVKARGDGAAEGFDRGDGRGGGAGHDDVDGAGELVGVAAEELDAVFDAVDGPGGAEFFDGDGLGGVEAFLVDPVLNCVEVDRGHFFGVSRVEDEGVGQSVFFDVSFATRGEE